MYRCLIYSVCEPWWVYVYQEPSCSANVAFANWDKLDTMQTHEHLQADLMFLKESEDILPAVIDFI